MKLVSRFFQIFRIIPLALYSFALSINLAAQTPPISGKVVADKSDSIDHLVGWWRMDETNGVSLMDFSKGRQNAILEGDSSLDKQSAPGVDKQAVRLDGKMEIRVNGYKGLPGMQARTVMAWIKTTAGNGEIVTWGTAGPGKKWMFGFVRGRVGLVPHGGYYYMKASTSDNAWHHVAVVLKEANPPNLHDHVTLFRDGTVAEVDDIGLLDLWPIDTGDKLDVKIGTRFNGLIDDVRIYDRALSEDEVKAIWADGNRQLAAKP